MRELLAAPIRRTSIIVGNLVAALALAALQVVVLIAASAARGASYQISLRVLRFVAAGPVFSIFMYGLAEILSVRLPSPEDYIMAVPAIAIVPFFLAGSRREYTVNTPLAPYRPRARPRPRRACCRILPNAGYLQRRIPQPHNEQPKLRRRSTPVPASPLTPAEIQGQPASIRPRRQLRAIAPEPDMPQEPIRLRNRLQLLIEHRPVLLPRRGPHHKSVHCVTPVPVLLHLKRNKNNYSNTRRELFRDTPCRHRTQLSTTRQDARKNADVLIDGWLPRVGARSPVAGSVLVGAPGAGGLD